MNQSLAAALSHAQVAVYGAILATAQAHDLNAYLVGGAVRDWQMGLPAGDLDFVIEGDAIEFARNLQRQFGGELLSHEPFRTATWGSHGLSTDIATARSETYARPAALPRVAPAPIDQDLLRRDFTINAMALRLRDDALLDPLRGQADLAKRSLRALHARSFVDDPTRILRGARYAARLGFEVESHTREWIDAGLPYGKDLSGERIKYDLELAFDIPNPAVALNLLREWGFFSSLGIVVPAPERMNARFLDLAPRVSAEWDWVSLGLPPHEVMHAVAWGALIYNLGQLSSSRWLELIPYITPVRDALVSLGVLSTLSANLFDAPPSGLSELLRPFDGLALLIGWLFDHDAYKRAAMREEWHTWRAVRPVTTGDDLKARGLPPGPQYRHILVRLRNAWLDGQVHSADEERALLDRLLAG